MGSSFHPNCRVSSDGWVQHAVTWGQTGSSADRAEALCAPAVVDCLPSSQLESNSAVFQQPDFVYYLMEEF